MQSKFLLLICGFALLTCQTAVSATSNVNGGYIAYTLSKDFIESHQEIFKRFFIKEVEDMQLRDVRVQQKTDQGRLTSFM